MRIADGRYCLAALGAEPPFSTNHTLHPRASETTRRHPYLIAGHTTRDLLDGGWRLGGSVAYATLGARAAGRELAVITGAGDDIRPIPLYDGVIAMIQNSGRTTTFRNVQDGERRVQYLYDVGAPLDSTSVPEHLLSTRVLHLAPIFGEIDRAFVASFNAELTGSTLQGWMRTRDGEIVRQALGEAWDAVYPLIDVAIYSVTDLKYSLIIDRIHPVISCCVETLGSAGVRIVEKGRQTLVPTTPMSIVDTDGAGDLFAYEFLARYAESGDPVAAARAGNAFVAQCLSMPGFRQPLYPPSPSRER